MRVHDEESAKQFEKAAADSLAAIKLAREAVAEAGKQKQKPDLSAISKRSPTPKPAPTEPPGPPLSSYDHTKGLAGVVDRWRSRGKADVQVDLDSLPEGETFLPSRAPIYVAHQEGVRDTEQIVGPAREKAAAERRELVEKVRADRLPEQQRIEAEKASQLQAARDYWENR